ncbi:MAG: urea transporter [Candidatus Aenigmarchaeota archaeon]|nr:urea transporter [Candidatus Aenigmarchaeota archaeon]
MRIIELLKIVFRGFSQVMLQNHAITGFLFIVGIFYNSWIMGLTALLGVITSTITAFILKYDWKDIHSGLYGLKRFLCSALTTSHSPLCV